jgi:hypothetical protein
MDLDSVDAKTAFKMGFAAYCADHNLPVKEAANLLKQAEHSLFDLAGLGIVGLPAGLGLALGGGLGYGAAKMDEPEITPDDIKAQELAKTYKTYTDRLKSRRAYQQYRAARQTR